MALPLTAQGAQCDTMHEMCWSIAECGHAIGWRRYWGEGPGDMGVPLSVLFLYRERENEAANEQLGRLLSSNNTRIGTAVIIVARCPSERCPGPLSTAQRGPQASDTFRHEPAHRLSPMCAGLC